MLNLFKVLADENRLKIFIMLLHEDYCVCDIVQFLQLKQANVSKHLMYFRTCHLVESNRYGKWNHYAISSATRNELKDLIRFIKNLEIAKEIEKNLKNYEKQTCN